MRFEAGMHSVAEGLQWHAPGSGKRLFDNASNTLKDADENFMISKRVALSLLNPYALFESFFLCFDNAGALTFKFVVVNKGDSLFRSWRKRAQKLLRCFLRWSGLMCSSPRRCLVSTWCSDTWQPLLRRRGSRLHDRLRVSSAATSAGAQTSTGARSLSPALLL